MSLTVAEIKSKLQPVVLRFIPPEMQKFVTDDELIDLANMVANDLNRQANIHTKRYYQKTIADQNAYEMEGEIIKVNLFKYHSSGYEDQMYAITTVSGTSHINSLIVLKDTPTGEIQMEIDYLRSILKVSDTPTDEIDLPDRILNDFLELMKVKIRTEFGNEPPTVYDQYLLLKARQVLATIDPPSSQSGISKSWLPNGTEDTQYDITDQRVSGDHIQANADGTYTWVE
jgi:hypothetical protein